jgi:TatA/E family protein of Tat protein translocase
MFGLSFTELIIIGVVALIVFGPEQLPKVLSQLGKVTGELKKTSDSLRREFYNSSFPPANEATIIKPEPLTLKSESSKESNSISTEENKTVEDDKKSS